MPANLTPLSSAAEVAGNTAMYEYACMTVCTGTGKWMHTLPSHPALGEPQGYSCEMQAKKQTSDKTVCRSCMGSTCLSLR